MASQTSLGRVQPLYKGNYDSNTIYNRLDNVYYNGDTWVCKSDGTTGVTPTDGSYWQKVASRGNTGGFGTPTATAFEVEHGDNPSVSIETSGPDTEKIFSFTFGIPAGPIGETGVQTAVASATGRKQDDSGDLAAGDPPWVEVALDTSDQELSLRFGIPPGHDGEGAVSKVDNIEPTGGNVVLGAVRYTVAQGLSNNQKLTARTNIGAIADPSSKTIGNYLRYEGNDTWSTHEVDVFPTGGRTGYYLQKSNSGTEWAPVAAVPSGGTINAVLTKQSSSDYDLTWTTIDAIPNSDIDDIISDN